MMVAPVAILMLALMGRCIRRSSGISRCMSQFAILFIAAFGFTRAQTFIGDKQFLRSMIPHHSGAS